MIAHLKEHGQAEAHAKKVKPKMGEKGDVVGDQPKKEKRPDAGDGEKPGKGKDRD